MDWRTRISVDPAVCHGKACVRGTRILVSVVLDDLAEGVSLDTILTEYPSVTANDVRACIAFAADLARDGHVDVPS